MDKDSHFVQSCDSKNGLRVHYFLTVTFILLHQPTEIISIHSFPTQHLDIYMRVDIYLLQISPCAFSLNLELCISVLICIYPEFVFPLLPQKYNVIIWYSKLKDFLFIRLSFRPIRNTNAWNTYNKTCHVNKMPWCFFIKKSIWLEIGDDQRDVF